MHEQPPLSWEGLARPAVEGLWSQQVILSSKHVCFCFCMLLFFDLRLMFQDLQQLCLPPTWPPKIADSDWTCSLFSCATQTPSTPTHLIALYQLCQDTQTPSTPAHLIALYQLCQDTQTPSTPTHLIALYQLCQDTQTPSTPTHLIAPALSAVPGHTDTIHPTHLIAPALSAVPGHTDTIHPSTPDCSLSAVPGHTDTIHPNTPDCSLL